MHGRPTATGFIINLGRRVVAGARAQQRPVERTAQEAWPHFRGWRVNYEAAAYKLALTLDAVPARWSGPRRHSWASFQPRAFINRTPDHPDGQPVTARGFPKGN